MRKLLILFVILAIISVSHGRTSRRKNHNTYKHRNVEVAPDHPFHRDTIGNSDEDSYVDGDDESYGAGDYYTDDNGEVEDTNVDTEDDSYDDNDYDPDENSDYESNRDSDDGFYENGDDDRNEYLEEPRPKYMYCTYYRPRLVPEIEAFMIPARDMLKYKISKNLRSRL